MTSCSSNPEPPSILIQGLDKTVAFRRAKGDSLLAVADGVAPVWEVSMDRRSFIVASASVLACGATPGWAADPPQGDVVKVEVEGPLGSLLRNEKSKEITASVLAGGGEFIIDGSRSKAAREELARLGDRYIKKGSAVVLLPRVRVTGRLEFRATRVVGEKGELADGPKVWFLVADSLAESRASGK
jgi:hypothetical protein